MGKLFLYEEIENYIKYGKLSIEIPEIVITGLSKRIELREYQEESIKNFILYYEDEDLSKNKQIHNLFHMATGSGKTVIMASLILYLYTKGYRKFIFFVNQTNILEKTKDNFTNKQSSKYLFNDEIKYLGNKINIKQVDNFSGSKINEDIEIVFTTTQKLYKDLSSAKENSLTYDDFENNKVVFISDESHHINSMTKKETKSEVKARNSWENSVTNALSRNRDSIMLEFTATADLKDKNVTLKYKDKIVYDYPLIKFRQSGYTKDFKNFGTESSLWERTLIALVMSEYRRYLFADLKINIKPIVMLKSQKIKESQDFYNEFFEKLEKLSSYELMDLYSYDLKEIRIALDYFKSIDESFELLEHSIQNSFSKEKSIIMNGSSDNNKENQLLINSLEDVDNNIRFIFAVDMLNEGWDVLNLFDIVRLYDTRQGGKSGKPGSYTIKEAQLIGRGARYCPFRAEEEQEKFKRKYDNDLENKNRILETMYFHSKNDSKYISELKQALIETGLQDEDPIELEYVLKDSFKETDFYKKGFVFSNKRVSKTRKTISGIEGSLKNKNYKYIVPSNRATVSSLIGNEEGILNNSESKIKVIMFKNVPYNILLGASEKFNELKFDVIKEKYPNVKSLKEFLTSDNYLGNSQLDITYVDEIKGIDLYNACKKAFINIANHIVSLKPEYEGTREFEVKPIRSVLKNKKIYLSSIDKNGGKGDSQIACRNDNYRLDLTAENWYVFNDNYGTSEEKLFVKYFKTNIEPKLKAKDLEYYVVRNERISNFAIYSFEHGERFEPDFLLFVRGKSVDAVINTQVYIEPKGNHLLKVDEWKEKFLLQIEDEHIINITHSDEFKVIGMPFFNEENRTAEFTEAMDKFIGKI